MYLGEGINHLHEHAQRHSFGKQIWTDKQEGHDIHKLIVGMKPQIQISVMQKQAMRVRAYTSKQCS